jgi:hypothetical protein
MVVQGVPQAGTYSPVDHLDRPTLRQRRTPTLRGEITVAEQIEHVATDYQRAVFCREHAEHSRRRWFAGRQREIAYVMGRAEGGDPRFRNMSRAQLQMTGAWRWSQSSQGQYLRKLEATFTDWAQMYLSFAEVEALNGHGLRRRVEGDS